MESEQAEQRVLFYDPEKCTGCRFCMISCALEHYNQLNMKKAYLETFFDEKKEMYESVQCQHCEDPVCLNSCPEEAIEKNEATGIVTINPMKCIGCGICVQACPLSVPWLNEELNIAVKCDFCNGDPKCAKYCSPGATRVILREEAYRLNEQIYGKGKVMKK